MVVNLKANLEKAQRDSETILETGYEHSRTFLQYKKSSNQSIFISPVTADCSVTSLVGFLSGVPISFLMSFFLWLPNSFLIGVQL